MFFRGETQEKNKNHPIFGWMIIVGFVSCVVVIHFRRKIIVFSCNVAKNIL